MKNDPLLNGFESTVVLILETNMLTTESLQRPLILLLQTIFLALKNHTI